MTGTTGNRKHSFVIIIGNEILSGRTRDVNLPWLGERLDALGLPVAEARVIPDVEQIIINTVNHARANFDYVFTTGGIGPTHDDITAASMARAFGVGIERNPEAQQALEAYYPAKDLTDARLKMADIPVGARLIENPVSGAPGFQLENVFVLPGVPKIMQAMFEGITDRLTGGAPVLTRSVITNLREGQLARDLEKLQQRFPDTTIGSYPFFKNRKFGVNVILRGTDACELDELEQATISMIKNLAGHILEP
ncbi:MAG: molybdopterin-binding protein, partial [Gammaproteobacteria bacterium]|nr:molybdopterin-binding protein [Gammaproteobacteria bacterium]